jgi:hypothetical protein
MFKTCLFAGLAITAPLLTARADVGWMEMDVAGSAPARYVTYGNFSSFRPVLTAEQIAVLSGAPADRNTAALSQSLSGTRIFEASIMQVFETPGKEIMSWDIVVSRLYVNCADRSLYLFSSEKIHRLEGQKTESFTMVPQGKMLDGKARWQAVLAEHVCNQQPWRERAARVNYSGGEPAKAGSYTFTCREQAMAEIGLGCDWSSDYESFRLGAYYAMKNSGDKAGGH